MPAEPFDPPGVSWTRVQFRLAWVRRAMLLIRTLLLVSGAVAVALLFPAYARWAWLGAGLLVVLSCWRFWLIGRAVRNLGYAEREEDLWITSGALFRRLTVVPYGRMQLVDVQQGPLERMAGLAQVQLHTAASGTNAAIPGLTPEDAARLRDRLTELGAAELSGL